MKPFPFITVRGEPLERGRQYGEQARERICKGIGHYKAQVARYALSSDDIASLTRDYLPIVERFEPAFVEEMRGIAEGSGTTFEDILLLNARTEILKLAEKPALRESLTASRQVPDGCTAVIVMPEATATGRLIHAQNWDWKAECAETGVVLKVEREDGPDLLTFTEAGALARTGLNASGMAITGNYLESDRDYREVGVPLALIRRKALESDNLALAMRTIYATRKSASNNMIVSHAGGIAINFECAPDETFQVHPENGLLVHANHWVSQAALAKLVDRGVANMPSTLFRDLRARDLLRPKVGRITPADVRTALLDDFQTPYSLCQPERPNTAGIITATVAMIIMEPELGTMQITPLPSRGTAPSYYSLRANEIRLAS
ncbi:C45 family autoproteolytic acyltransferase/hydolase [uncultured Enterovirga sp.]|uniref:C45 family autoproteolytic acyltransferase/hydolase n=1 Tax=uncultured Enterovirga sp. TaxID=2026352 RepID=UPI0035CB21BD